ncbi:MAG: ATPase domain-containing protein [Nanoarchaeota archaeon]
MIKSKPELERVPTGIKGLDDAMAGGFIKGSINLVAGCPGSGKSIFAMQYLVNGAKKYNEPGVYITFEERTNKLTEYMGNFGWDLKDLVANKKIGILEQSPVDIKKATAKELLGLKFKIVRELKAKRLVIDSMSAFSLLFNDDFERRTAHMQLFEMLRDWGVTALLTAEYDVEDHKAMPLDFEVDSIVWLYNMKKTDVRTRALEIYKMRGSKHLQKIFPLEISDKGIIIYPEQSIF